MADDLTVGAVIAGRYRLERLLAEGGMGVVWAAKHMVTRKPVALKFVKGEAANDDRTRRRLLREARAACAVQHPNVVAVHDVMELESGSPVLVMDLLRGESLRAKLDREGKIPLHDLANILIPVVSAVGTAHSCGVVHRDLKPENIFLAEMPGGIVQVKVLDFGIAKLTSSEGIMAQSAVLTGTGLLLGTPDYMSLEQILGEEDVDHRADIWALGIVFYECLGGRRPTAAENVGKVLKIILTNTIPPINQVMPQLPEDIKALINRMLTLDRNGRPTDLREVGHVLERYSTVPLLPFDLPRARPLSEMPPSMPPTQVAPPPIPMGPRVRSGTLGESGSANAGSLLGEARADITPAPRDPGEIRARPPPPRPAAGARPLPPPPVKVPPAPRVPTDASMRIALDEPFATDPISSQQPGPVSSIKQTPAVASVKAVPVSSGKQVTMNKSLTLGDLLSPDELVMLGERLEKAQSLRPGKRASPAPEPPPESVSEPISVSDIIPVSAAVPPESLTEVDEIAASSEPETVPEPNRRGTPLPPDVPPPFDPNDPFVAVKGRRRDLTDTLPVPFHETPPPTLPFTSPRGSEQSTPRPHPASRDYYTPPPSPHRLSFSHPGGSRDFSATQRSISATAPPSFPPFQRTSDVQTPPSTAAPTPPALYATAPPPRRPFRWLAVASLALGACVAGFWLLTPGPSQPSHDAPRDDAAVPSPQVTSTNQGPSCPSGMAFIPGDTFMMGNADGRPDEKPPHPIVIGSFCLDMTEVTVASYQRCVDETHCDALARQVSLYKTTMTPSDRALESRFCVDPKRDSEKNLPINCVNWTEANTFCRVQGKRLPTEEEWEYAARGGAELRVFPWGAAPPSPKLLNACGSECAELYERLTKVRRSSMYPESDGQSGLAPVGTFPAGATRYGTYDMSGNVWEWTESAMCPYPSHSCSRSTRVFRGGSWVNATPAMFSGTTRMSGAPESRYMDVGFRCAKEKG
jgi:eukaryotic-like serine/threonine-protein kinase